jgi:hypothetical protein
VDRPVITEADYQAGSERLVLRARGVAWEDAGREVAAAIGRGRAIVATFIAEPPGDAEVEDVLSRAAMSPWRVNLARWLLSHGAPPMTVDRYFTLTDFHHLGTSAALPDAWGHSGWLVEGCWCLHSPGRRQPEDWLGRSAGLAAIATSDLPLRVTELLAELELPHALLEALLPLALQDVIDRAQQISTSDWEAFAWPRDLTTSRIETYLLELVADGVLAAPREGRR